MTRGDFKSRLRRELRLTTATYLGGDPFALNDLCREAADEVASRTDCLYGQRTKGITEEEAVYCLPDFYKVKTVHLLDASGQWDEIDTYDDPSDMDREYGSAWRTAPASDPACAGVFYGVNQIHLYPTPSVTRAAALRFEGFRKPGPFWTYDGDGNGILIRDVDECPLPSYAHEAVYRCARYKAAQLEAVDRPEIAALIGPWGIEYDGGPGRRGSGALGPVEAHAALHHARLRQRTRRRRYGR